MAPELEKDSTVLISEDNIVVNGLWIGNRLSLLEELTIRSFLKCGHRFRIWVYETLENELPTEVEVMDANMIIPKDRIFRYRNKNQFGHGKGSVSGFSDVFRYKLLYDEGGWWVDMDVTCLRPLDISSPYYFRPHHELKLVGNVMKCPKGSELMKNCYERASSEVDENNTDWHKPIQILVDAVTELNLENFILSGLSYQDRWEAIKPYIYSDHQVPNEHYFIHWMNEEWRSRELDKYDFMISSTYGAMLRETGVVDDDFNAFNRLKNKIRFNIKRLID